MTSVEALRLCPDLEADRARPAVCCRAELSISRSLDGLLTRTERDALARHLARCGDCAEFVRLQQAHRRRAAGPRPRAAPAEPRL